MTTNDPPHLLTLPPEIRYHIYSYLHHTIRLRNFHKRYLAILDLVNTPLLPVLLTHPQITTEYRDTPFFKHLTVRVRSPIKRKFFEQRTDPSSVATLPLIRHLCVEAAEQDSHSASASDSEEGDGQAHWHLPPRRHALHLDLDQVATINRLKGVFPALLTIRVSRVDGADLHYAGDLRPSRATKIELGEGEVPSEMLLGMRVIQAGTGFRWVCVDEGEVYERRRVRVWVHAKDGCGRFCVARQVAVGRFRNTYAKGVLEGLEERFEGSKEMLGAKLLGWEEERMLG